MGYGDPQMVANPGRKEYRLENVESTDNANILNPAFNMRIEWPIKEWMDGFI